MARATMYQEPLETYLLNKIRDHSPLSIKRVKIKVLGIPELGCNWDIAIIEPSLPVDMIRVLERDVIAPLKAEINVAA
jgi:hypothetical protein